MALHETRYEHDGQAFVCLEDGPHDRPVVVLVHGFPDQPASWTEVADHLVARGYRVIAPWLRGYHPDTVIPGRAYAADVLGDDLVRLLAAATDAPVVAVGHDWGAMAVWAAATLAPDRFAGVVPVAIPHARALTPSPKGLWALRHFLTLRLPSAEATARRNDYAYLDTLLHRWAPTWSGRRRDRVLGDAKALFADDVRLSGAIAYYRAFRLAPPRALTDRVAVRGLLIAGSEDFGGLTEPFERTPEVGFRNGTAARLALFHGVGHWPHLEAEDRFLTAVDAFLDEVLPTPG